MLSLYLKKSLDAIFRFLVGSKVLGREAFGVRESRPYQWKIIYSNHEKAYRMFYSKAHHFLFRWGNGCLERLIEIIPSAFLNLGQEQDPLV